jgi:hypothetical protein
LRRSFVGPGGARMMIVISGALVQGRGLDPKISILRDGVSGLSPEVKYLENLSKE